MNQLLDLYRCMLTSRKVDDLEKALALRGEVPFYISSCGHEAMAALAAHLQADDWLHCHYRDKALLLARGLEIEDFFYTVLGKKASSSAGRRMPGFPCKQALNILSPPTLVANNALQAVGIAMAIRSQESSPLVYCGVGEGSTQEGEYLEALAEAARSQVPVLFVVQDNRYALSTPTRGMTFYSTPAGELNEYWGIPILYADGTQPGASSAVFETAVGRIRETRGPQIVVMKLERLASHTNSDDQRIYRSGAELEKIREYADPLKNLAALLLQQGTGQSVLDAINAEQEVLVNSAMALARAGAEPEAVLDAKLPLPLKLTDVALEYRDTQARSLNMLQAMRATLANRLAKNTAASLYGQDIEDPKGDVFGLTRGLSTRFPLQVKNSPLSESTIVGVAIGRALAGEQPVALLQFADFMPVAYNQIMSELGSIYWRSNGDWQCPVIIMSVCGGYRPGLGPFHSQTPTSVAAHIPGVDVFVPSNAADAAGLLNAAFASGRPSLFFYPKNLLNDPALATSCDVEKHLVPIGKASILRKGKHLTLVSWGSTMPICHEVAVVLEEIGLLTEIIDLRTIYPWDQQAVIASAEKTGHLLVIHEDNHTCGVGGEILATVAEHTAVPIRFGRVAQADTYVPYHYGNHLQVLPSFKSVLNKAAQMLNLDIKWEEPLKVDTEYVVVNAIGSSPSDETLSLTALAVNKGSKIKVDELLASVEADKAIMDICSPVDGIVEEIYLNLNDVVRVGTPLMKIKASNNVMASTMMTPVQPRPIIRKRRDGRPAPLHAAGGKVKQPVILSSISSVLGARRLSNEDLISQCPGWSSAEIKKRTGIEYRHWIGPGESALTLGVAACKKLLAAEQLNISDIDAIVCSTGTPLSPTPSLACRILKELSGDSSELSMAAYDISAACAGYLYALQAVYDMLEHKPDAKILLVTSETLSPVLDSKDSQTYFLFGDAATASLLTCEPRKGNINALVKRPHLSAMGAAEKTLYVPSLQSAAFLEMDGKPVYRLAVRKMIEMLDVACSAEQLTVDDLAMIVPHQANERIIEAVRKTIGFPTAKIYYSIRDFGNTSSNSIPLGLEAMAGRFVAGEKIGMTAFGGGYTFAAGLLEKL